MPSRFLTGRDERVPKMPLHGIGHGHGRGSQLVSEKHLCPASKTSIEANSVTIKVTWATTSHGKQENGRSSGKRALDKRNLLTLLMSHDVDPEITFVRCIQNVRRRRESALKVSQLPMDTENRPAQSEAEEELDVTSLGGQTGLIIALCFICMVICSLDRVAMSVALLPMSYEFGLSETQKGAISSVFSLGYMTAMLPAGEDTILHILKTFSPIPCLSGYIPRAICYRRTGRALLSRQSRSRRARDKLNLADSRRHTANVRGQSYSIHTMPYACCRDCDDRGAGVGVESQGGAGGRGGHLVRGPDPQPRCRTLLPPTARTYPTNLEI